MPGFRRIVFGPGVLLTAAMSACNWVTVVARNVERTIRPSRASITGRFCRRVSCFDFNPTARLLFASCSASNHPALASTAPLAPAGRFPFGALANLPDYLLPKKGKAVTSTRRYVTAYSLSVDDL